MRPNFSSLLSNYPSTNTPCNGSWENQCAIRMSIALQKSGLSLSKYTEPTCKHGHARGAESLANHLWNVIGPASKYFNPKKSNVAGRTGIIFFKDIASFRGGRGDHIDLWNLHKTITGEYFDACQEVWFWSL